MPHSQSTYKGNIRYKTDLLTARVGPNQRIKWGQCKLTFSSHSIPAHRDSIPASTWAKRRFSADSDALEPISVPSESHERGPGLRLKSRDARVRGSGRLKTRYTVPNSPSLPSPNSSSRPWV